MVRLGLQFYNCQFTDPDRQFLSSRLETLNERIRLKSGPRETECKKNVIGYAERTENVKPGGKAFKLGFQDVR